MPTRFDELRKIASLLFRVAVLVYILVYLWPKAMLTVGDFFFPASGPLLGNMEAIASQLFHQWQSMWHDLIKWAYRFYLG